MRVVFVSVALALVAAVSAQAAPSPPVIHESFTLLPCPMHPQTMVGLEGCSEHAIVTTDRKIDAQVKKVFRLLTAPGARATFAASERSWLRYRNASCNAQSSFYTGGSAQPVAYAQCVLQRNHSHLVDLAALEHVLTQH
jgi:uncharacterized protein YecT (DUF1311 family)